MYAAVLRVLFLLLHSLLHGVTIKVGETSTNLRLVVENDLTVNSCAIGNPVFSMKPATAAAFVFGATHEVRTQHELDHSQASSLLGACKHDVRRFVHSGFEDLFDRIPAPTAEHTREWISHATNLAEGKVCGTCLDWINIGIG